MYTCIVGGPKTKSPPSLWRCYQVSEWTEENNVYDITALSLFLYFHLGAVPTAWFVATLIKQSQSLIAEHRQYTPGCVRLLLLAGDDTQQCFLISSETSGGSRWLMPTHGDTATMLSTQQVVKELSWKATLQWAHHWNIPLGGPRPQLIDWAVVLRYTRHKIGYFGDVFPSQSLSFFLFFFSGMHHYDYIAPYVDIRLHRGRFWAISWLGMGKKLNLTR